MRITQGVTTSTSIPFRLLSISLVDRLSPGYSLAGANVSVSRRGPTSDCPGAFIPKHGVMFLAFTTVLTHDGKVFGLMAKISRTSFDNCPSYHSAFIHSLGIALGLTVSRRFIVRAPLVSQSGDRI